MLKLTYCRASDEFKKVTVLGDPEGIRDLYWQLTHNYKATDGAAIWGIQVTNLDGYNVTMTVMSNPHGDATVLSSF